MNGQEWVLVIGAIFTGVCTVINTLKTQQVKKISKDSNQKLDDVKIKAEINQQKLERIGDSNSIECEIKEKLRAKESQVQYLQRLIDELISQLPASAVNVAKNKTRRRYEDFLDRKEAEGDKR